MQVDLDYFYRSGQILWQTGKLAEEPPWNLPWYLPFLSRVFIPVGMLSQAQISVLWPMFNILILILTVRAVGRSIPGLSPKDWPITQIAPALLASPWLFYNAKYNQLTLVVLGLCVAFYLLLESGRSRLAGAVLGLAVLVKVTPVWFAVWLVLKRKWQALLAAAATIILLGPISDAIHFGPARAAGYYNEWRRNAVSESGHAGLIKSNIETDRRNQGIGVVLRRWLTPTNSARQMWADPRFGHDRAPWTINVVDMNPTVVAVIAGAVLAALAAAVIWACRKPWSLTQAERRLLEFALFLTSMLLAMPVLRVYHTGVVYVALAVLMATRQRRLESSQSVMGINTALAAYTILGISYASDWCQAAGFHWLAVAVLAASLLIERLRTPQVTDSGEPK
jgi:hypothetical protein